MALRRQSLIIGLGQFGMAVARALSTRGVEVLAVDVREERVRAASSFVAEAACFDATDTDLLARAAPERRDVCVCAIGDEAKEASIICTALLRQMGARRVIARANDELHARILGLVGAHQVVNPEREYGERFANQVVHAGIKGELPLGEGLLISEVEAPPSFVGRTLDQLQLPRRFEITVVAVRKYDRAAILVPEPTTSIEAGDVLVVVAREDAVTKMMDRS